MQWCITVIWGKTSFRFTDKALIFDDLSVNGGAFAKCSTRSISTSRRDYGQSAVLELFVRNQAKISLEFTDKALIFDDLSVSKTHFTDKQGIFNDLSVNFWPLWWGFTDKVGFLDHLSVKPGSKRLKSYGQTAIFDHFVRNRHFLSRPFTDKAPIFIDVSVNGSDFAKCSARQIIAPRICRQPRLGYFRHSRSLSCIRKNPDESCN